MKPDLRKRYAAEIKKRKLSTKEVKRLRLRALDDAGAKAAGFNRHFAGAVVWYPDDDMERIRYFDPPRGIDGKPQKYSQNRRGVAAYFCPLLTDWKNVLKDARKALLITEGEFKAIAAAQHGRYCIALGGVYNVVGRDDWRTLMPSLERIEWKDREVYIVFDSDAITNPNVRLAEARLARLLLDRGARLRIVRMPPDGKEKVGLDDYLHKHGAEALDELLNTTPEVGASAELHRMNTEVVYVEQPNAVVRLNDFLVMGTQPFRSDYYADRVFKTEDGKLAPTARAWMTWPNRNKANGLTFSPGRDLFVEDGERRLLNAWRGWGAEPVKGDVTTYLRLMERIFGNLPLAQKGYAQQWFANPLQRPGTKQHTAMVLFGRQGTGKSLVAKYHRLLYGEAGAEITQAELDSAFNSWIKNKCFVQGEEVTTRETRRSVAELLKSWITGHTVPINEKYIPAYTLPNLANFCLTSNHDDAFYLEDSDRRYFVVEVDVPPMTTEEGRYFGTWIEEQSNRNALLYHLMYEVDCSGFEPGGHAPITDARQAMIDAGLSDLDAWVRDLPDSMVHPDSTIRKIGPLHTPRELLLLYQGKTGRYSEVSMGLALKRAGFRRVADKQVKVAGRLERLWATQRDLEPNQLKTLLDVERESRKEAGKKETFRRTR